MRSRIVSSPERIYALLVEANPIPDPRAVPPVLLHERSIAMPTREPTEAKQVIAKPRYARALAAFAVTVVVIGAFVVAWVVAAGDGPVAAADAQIDVTFTGDATSYVGHREIIEGAVGVSFTNGSEDEVALAVLRYETGSVELADELKVVAEGESVRPGDHAPVGDFELVQAYPPGTHPVRIELQPGTYLVDISHGEDGEHVVSRAAVIEVVAGD